MLEAVVFDMDGVLADSEGAYDSVVETIMGEMGFTVPREEQLSFRGVPSKITWECLAERYALTSSPEELWRREHEIIEEQYARGEIPAIPYAFELLKDLKRGGLKIAVATSNVRSLVQLVLEQNEAKAFVDAVSCVDDVENGKPAPDLFLNAARLLGVAPEHCAAVEDSPNGIKAAKAAGMKVACYANPDLPKLDHSGADLVVSSFKNLTRQTFEALVKE